MKVGDKVTVAFSDGTKFERTIGKFCQNGDIKLNGGISRWLKLAEDRAKRKDGDGGFVVN
mgnify:CR=1 FL=1